MSDDKFLVNEVVELMGAGRVGLALGLYRWTQPDHRADVSDRAVRPRGWETPPDELLLGVGFLGG